MASPSSPAGFSDAEPGSPSPRHLDKSYMTNVTASLTEDEDNTTRIDRYADTPEPAERHHGGRGGGGGRGRGGRDSAAGGGLFKDPSAIGKIRHLKKEDGEPLWRYDIQYDFLRAVFDDERKVFTNSYEPEAVGKQCFADLYIDTMARSSKTSKILHDKLLSDRKAAKSMAMVCLLVNIGRMNTTLNFFPEMRAQLRTYHAIPSLQVHQDTHAYKQLQDAPRLKSILKGGSEDRPEPRSLEKLKERDVPRTNPVNLIFLICHSAAKVAELHFPPGREFHDLIMRTNLSSKSRAAAFLWIMWFYLESDFTEEGCEENPFGAGVDYGVDVANQGVPVLEELTPEEEGRENQDTPEEREFGIAKKNLRSSILRDEQMFTDSTPVKRSSRTTSRPSAAASASLAASVKESSATPADGESRAGGGPPAILPRIRPSKHDSDADSTRSTPPPRSLSRSFGGAGGGGGSGAASRRAGPLKYQIIEGSSPARQPPLIQQLHQQQQQQQLMRKRGAAGLGGGAGGRQAHKMARLMDLDEDDGEDGAHTPTPATGGGRKPRPPTAHQIAVENNRKQRIEYLLSRGMQRKHHRSRKQRRVEGAIVRALRRLEEVEDPFADSESEDHVAWNRGLFSFQPGAARTKSTGDAFRERGFGGLVLLNDETDDFGEEVAVYAAAVRRASRRMNRWNGGEEDTEVEGEDDEAAAHKKKLAVVRPIKRMRVHVAASAGGQDDEFRDPNETEDEMMDTTIADALELALAEVPTDSTTKRRRTAGTAGGSRARGAGGAGRASTAGKTTAAGANGRRRRAPAATAAAAASAAAATAEADTDMGETKLGAAGDEDNEEEELNDMDKTLLGMGDGDSDSE